MELVLTSSHRLRSVVVLTFNGRKFLRRSDVVDDYKNEGKLMCKYGKHRAKFFFTKSTIITLR